MAKEKDLQLHTVEPVLEETKDGLILRKGDLILRGDFTDLIPRIRKNNLQQELLIRASGILKKGPGLLAIDATAGMGEDALLLAAAGFRVILYEKDPVIAALLRDAMKRAETVPELAASIGRMELREEDSVEAMKAMKTSLMMNAAGSKMGNAADHTSNHTLGNAADHTSNHTLGNVADHTSNHTSDNAAGEARITGLTKSSNLEEIPELIYLDPMFPARSKSGLIKKKFQLLQQLEAPEAYGDQMLQAALELHPRRIVVKRPLKGEVLGGVKPSFSLEGKAIRYDGHVLAP